MNKILRSLFLSLVVLLSFAPANAQTALKQTTLAAAVTSSSSNQIAVASVTGITANNTLLFIDQEALFVEAVSGTTLQVQRGASGTRASTHVSGAGVLAGPPNAFASRDPQGACANGSGVFLYSPVVNVTDGLQWLCGKAGFVIPGFGNNTVPRGFSAAVASVAGAILPTGPLFHVTGTNAITGITLPVGFNPQNGQTISIVADAVFTWTAAGNIATTSAIALLGSTSGVVIVGKVYTFVWDSATTKFYILGA
jgi:hypothetical protein